MSISSQSKVPHGVPSNLTWCWNFKTKFTAFDSHNCYLMQTTFISQARKVKVQRNIVSCSKKAIRPSNLKLRDHFMTVLSCFLIWVCVPKTEFHYTTQNDLQLSILLQPPECLAEGITKALLTHFSTKPFYIKRYLILCLESPASHVNRWTQKEQALQRISSSEPYMALRMWAREE